MKKIIFLLGWSFLTLSVQAQQTAEANQLVSEGVEQHDKGNYEEALKKYDAAIQLDPKNFDANYEKVFTLFTIGKKKECVSICRMLLKEYKEHPRLNLVYVQYGSVLDDLGKPDEAIQTYEQGIQQFPEDYMLWFNEALTLYRLDRLGDAEKKFQQALVIRPLHSSSNYYLGMLLEKRNKIPSLLSTLTFLAVEPNSNRSKDGLTRVRSLMNSNIKKDGNKIEISLDPSMLDSTKKNDPDNFRTVELIMTFSAALEKDTTLAKLAKTPADKLSLSVQQIINALDEKTDAGQGFYRSHFVPFFVEMKKKDLVGTLCHLAYLKTSGEEEEKWLSDHEEEVNSFYDWLKGYKW